MNKKNTKYWIMGAVAVIIIMGLTFPFLMAKSRLNAEITKLRKEGLPVSSREFADKYYKPIPKAENAADTFDDAYGLYAREKDYKKLIIAGTAKSPQYDQKILPQLLTAAQEFISDNKALLDKMGELRKYDCIYFDYEWEKSFEIPLQRLNNFRNTVRIYYVKTELNINQNNPQKAGESIIEIFHINKLLGRSPFMIGQLVFYACDSISTAMLERCMNTLDFSPEQLKEFQKICAEHEKYVIRRWPYMWKLELALLLDWAKNRGVSSYTHFSPYLSYSYIKKIPRKYRVAFYYYSGSCFNDLVSQTQLLRAMMDVPVDIYLKRKVRLEKIRDDAERDQSSSFFSGTSINFYLKTMRLIAQLRCAGTACAIERFHLKYKKFPQKLEQLVPEFLPKIPIDPFDGKPLRYFRGKFDMRYEEPLPPKEVKKKKSKEKKKKGSIESMFGDSPQFSTASELKYKTVTLKKTGFYVYSIGRDLSDDSSLPLWERKRKDILFIVIDKK